MVIFGWDASDFDWPRGPVDLVSAAVQDGISFFTHKATEGTKIQHVHYGEAMDRARAAGIPFLGAYFVPRTPGNNGHGPVADQVAYFLAYLDAQTPWWRTFPGFFFQVDLEHWGYDDVPPWVGVEACRLLNFAATGKWVVLYAPRWSYGDTIPGTDPLWASSYGANPAVPYRQAYPGDASSGWAPYSGRTPTFLQYGSQLTIGSQPTCDANAFRGSIDELRALITGGTMAGMWDEPSSIKGISRGQQFDDLWQMAIEGRPGGSDTVTRFQAPNGWAMLLAAIKTQAVSGGAVQATQDQVNTGVLNAMLDPRVQAGIGAAIASHLKVT